MHSYKNNIHLEGNLGKNAELKSTANGNVVNFSVAVNEQWEKDGQEQKHTDWFQIEVWGPLRAFWLEPVSIFGSLTVTAPSAVYLCWTYHSARASARLTIG